jgi:hypothetical protein
MEDTATTYFVSRAYRERQQQDHNTAVVTAVNVARDIYIEQHGNRYTTPDMVTSYISSWLLRNGADQYNRPADAKVDHHISAHAHDLVEAVWALAELPQQDPLTLVDDDYRGTSDEARQMLTNQYERDLQDALNRITWKA